MWTTPTSTRSSTACAYWSRRLRNSKYPQRRELTTLKMTVNGIEAAQRITLAIMDALHDVVEGENTPEELHDDIFA